MSRKLGDKICCNCRQRIEGIPIIYNLSFKCRRPKAFCSIRCFRIWAQKAGVYNAIQKKGISAFR